MNNVLHLFPEPEAVKGDFEAVWKIWPNKAKKVLAKAKYDAILKGGFRTRTLDKDSGQYVDIELAATPDSILLGAKAYIDSQFDRSTYRFKDDGKFIPHLATWLNGGRWEDWL